MHAHFVKHRESGDQFLALEVVSTGKISGTKAAFVDRLFCYDVEGNACMLYPADIKFDGLLPDQNPAQEQEGPQVSFSPLIVPHRH